MSRELQLRPLYQNERIFQPCLPYGFSPVTKEDLYDWITTAFDSSHPIHKREGFTDQTAPFYGGTEKRIITPQVPANEVSYRLNIIIDILNSLGERTKQNAPAYSISQVYRVFSVIACNWLVIHGCLGDGHGRTLMQFLPITLERAGYPQEFRRERFTNPDTGRYDPLMGKIAVVLLNGHFLDGLRIAAARIELGRTERIDEILLNPAIIGHARTRRQANIHALGVIGEAIKDRYFSFL